MDLERMTEASSGRCLPAPFWRRWICL